LEYLGGASSAGTSFGVPECPFKKMR
jgi:hypothetical protein